MEMLQQLTLQMGATNSQFSQRLEQLERATPGLPFTTLPPPQPSIEQNPTTDTSSPPRIISARPFRPLATTRDTGLFDPDQTEEQKTQGDQTTFNDVILFVDSLRLLQE